MVERIIFDWKRTLFDPEQSTLLPGAQSVIETLDIRGFTLVLIGRGEDDMYRALDSLGARSHFRAVHFVAEKSDLIFKQYVSEANPEATLAVGDRAHKEIALAKSLGARAVWLRAGRFCDELPLPGLEPDEIITDIESLLESPLLHDSQS